MSSKKGAMTQFAFIGAAVVVVVVGALLLFGRGGKNTAPHKSKTPAADQGMVRKVVKKPLAGVVHTVKAGRDALKAQRRAERLKQKQDARAGGSRTSRSSSGGYSQGGTSRGSSLDPTQLRAILTDGTGSRFALVGDRQYKSGDDIEGRRVLEVTGDGVKMEYRDNTYDVKVGQKVY
jgi:hypothetical protein